jgi:ribonuclease VapC
MNKYVLDSFAMIAFFEDEVGSEPVSKLLRKVAKQKIRAYMTVINWGEMYYCTARVQGEDAAERVLRQFNKYGIQLVEADQGLTYEAAKLKARFKIAYADCFAAALSSKLKATLVTGDPEFRELETDVSIQWIGQK